MNDIHYGTMYLHNGSFLGESHYKYDDVIEYISLSTQQTEDKINEYLESGIIMVNVHDGGDDIAWFNNVTINE